MPHSLNLDIMATMTTIPSRIEYIRPVVEAALRQSVLVSGLEINIPLTFGRTGEAYVIPQWLTEMERVHIFRTEDYGSITKVAPTFERHLCDQKTYIWSIDDDVALPPNQLELLLHRHSDGHRRVLARYGGALNNGADFQSWFGEGPVTFFEGFGSVLYPPTPINSDFSDYVRITSQNEDCRRSDDIVLSMYFNRIGMEIYLYNKPSPEVPYMVSGWLEHAGADALSSGGHREKYGRVFEFINSLYPSRSDMT